LRDIVPIVEGPGDVQATPVLLRKILFDRFDCYDIGIATPKNARGRSSLDRPGGIEKFVEYAALTPNCGAIIVLVDADNDCAAELAEQICSRCKTVGVSVPIAVVCAVREYEAWFLASLHSIRGHSIRGGLALDKDVVYEGNLEALSGVKEWITQQMPSGRAYRETSDQVSMTSLIDVSLAHTNSRSFKRLCHAVEELRSAMLAGSAAVTPF